MSRLDELNAQLREAYDDLEDTEKMDDEAACFHSGTNTKQEALESILDWINDLISQIERVKEEEAWEQRHEAKQVFHDAFITESSFWAYKGY